MKSLLRCIFLLLALIPLSAHAATTPVNPADFTIPVHVAASELLFVPGNNVENQVLRVVIDGKRLQLSGAAISSALPKGHVIGFIHVGLLPLGDYKARLVDHTPPYQPSFLNFGFYEILLPDNHTLLLQVTGMYE